MAGKLFNILKESCKIFREKALTEIPERDYTISSPGDKKIVHVTNSQIKSALRKICPLLIDELESDIKNHFEIVRNYIQFCSSPQSFRTAWDLRSETLSPYDADRLIKEGAQLIPQNRESRIFQYIQQGNELGPKQRLLLGVRHSEGNYDDKLNEVGQFQYQPPNNTTGMLRYRWCQYLAEQFKGGFIILAIMWFKTKINEDINHVFIISPVKIIEMEKDLGNIGDTLQNPLNLQLISRQDALSSINHIFTLAEPESEYEKRFPLEDRLAREFSYDKIKATSKGRNIKRWAQTTGKRCPGTHCKNAQQNIEFKDLKLSEIAFGHIISQKWASTFPFLSESVNHPDNLYLTCRNCNSSLNFQFPDKQLRDRIEKTRTIGDWLRNHEQEIRK